MIEPPPTRWDLAAARPTDGEDLVAIGADLEPGTLLPAYRAGLFPMGLGPLGEEPLGWWSPLRRGVLLPGDLHVSRSLRRSAAGFRTSVDRAFEQVVDGCAAPDRDGRWITPQVASAYARLHRLGWAHSVEVWEGDDLVGGLYGIGVGGLFAGESMFHRRTDASKFALWTLVDLWFADQDPSRLIDVQWSTPHLQSLGVREIDRQEYLDRLSAAVDAAGRHSSRIDPFAAAG